MLRSMPYRGGRGERRLVPVYIYGDRRWTVVVLVAPTTYQEYGNVVENTATTAVLQCVPDERGGLCTG